MNLLANLDSIANLKAQLASFIILIDLNEKKKKQNMEEEHNLKNNRNLIIINIEVRKNNGIKKNKEITMEKNRTRLTTWKKINNLIVGMELDVEGLLKENVIFSILKLKINRELVQEEDSQWILNKLLRTKNLTIDATKWIEDAHLDILAKIYFNIVKKKKKNIISQI